MFRTLRALSPIEGRLQGGVGGWKTNRRQRSNDKASRDGAKCRGKKEPDHRSDT